MLEPDAEALAEPQAGFAPANLQNAPSGTLQGRAYLGIKVTVREGLLRAHSFARFYFAPDSTSGDPGEVTYKIWRVEDGPTDWTPEPWLGAGHPLPAERLTWGKLLSLYR